MMSEKTQGRSIANWQRAPRDGTIINVEFADGKIEQALWDSHREHWHLSRPDGALVTMHSARHDVPQDWWPIFG
jgi:hypothetical protein